MVVFHLYSYIIGDFASNSTNSKNDQVWICILHRFWTMIWKRYTQFSMNFGLVGLNEPIGNVVKSFIRFLKLVEIKISYHDDKKNI